MELTTSLKATEEQEHFARKLAARLGCRFIPRKSATFHCATYVLEKASLVLYSQNRYDKLFFHPSMAKPRIMQQLLHQRDSFLNAMQLKRGDQVLDCTLGLATDALLASFAVGEAGHVIGLESEAGIAEIVRLGLKNIPEDRLIDWKSLYSRIEVVNHNYKSYLTTLDDRSFDVVYLDPMFQNPIDSSLTISPLKRWANFETPNSKDITQALRVARRCVVMKSHKEDSLLEELGFTPIDSRQRICFGRLEVG